MRKIRLQPETLTVESFIPAEEQLTLRGTVNGQQILPSPSPFDTGMSFCETNCDCTLGCPSIAPCTTVEP